MCGYVCMKKHLHDGFFIHDNKVMFHFFAIVLTMFRTVFKHNVKIFHRKIFLNEKIKQNHVIILSLLSL